MTTATALPGTVGSTMFCEAVGVTYRQLDNWVRHGVLTPVVGTGVGCGYPRLFQEADIPVAKAALRFSNTVAFASGAKGAAAAMPVMRTLTGTMTGRIDQYEGCDLYILRTGHVHVTKPDCDAVFIHRDVWS